MKIFKCVCENTLFFENTQCLGCSREVGWCPNCNAVSPVEIAAAGDPMGGTAGAARYRCLNPSCGMSLAKCANYAGEAVCNRFVIADGAAPAAEFCDCCRFNDTVPDLSIDGNREKWRRIEAAKRRLIYMLDVLGLPYGTADDGIAVPLSFDFKGDDLPQVGRWRASDETEKVYTGHDTGKITINIREADDAEREALRVSMGETQRTLIGHFRHEIGHYYWDLLIRDHRAADFTSVFGDPDNPTYAEALERHYETGPPEDWAVAHISAYATMHPWEDWAETFAFYLDIASILETTSNVGLIATVDLGDFDTMLTVFSRIGIVANELNRTMGLIDLVPETIVPDVKAKLRFVHETVRAAQTP